MGNDKNTKDIENRLDELEKQVTESEKSVHILEDILKTLTLFQQHNKDISDKWIK